MRVETGQYVLAIEEEMNRWDCTLAQQILQSGTALDVRSACGAGEAIRLLRYAQGDAHRGPQQIPGLLIIDLTFGCITGWEVLAWASKQAGLRTVAIIARVSEGDTSGISRAMRLGVHRCVGDSEELLSALRVLEVFWSAKNLAA